MGGPDLEQRRDDSSIIGKQMRLGQEVPIDSGDGILLRAEGASANTEK